MAPPQADSRRLLGRDLDLARLRPHCLRHVQREHTLAVGRGQALAVGFGRKHEAPLEGGLESLSEAEGFLLRLQLLLALAFDRKRSFLTPFPLLVWGADELQRLLVRRKASGRPELVSVVVPGQPNVRG